MLVMLIQGCLKIWTEHSTLILLNFKLFKIALQKFQQFFKLGRNEFAPSLEGVAQKMGLPCPFEVSDVFVGKFKFEAPRAFKFSTKQVLIEVYNQWKFGLYISNHLEIQNWRFFSFILSPTWKKNNFQKQFFFKWGTLVRKKSSVFYFSNVFWGISR